MEIRYFFIIDNVKCGQVSIVYCPMELIWADFHTKPIQGSNGPSSV